MTSHFAAPGSSRRLALTGLVIALALLAVLIQAGVAFGSATSFCLKTFASGETCTGFDYHHTDAVDAVDVTGTYYNNRKCANARKTNGDVVGDWVCGYGQTVRKYTGGEASYGTIHDGDPSSFRMYGIQYF